MNVGISTACFYPEEPLDIIDKIGKLGFKDIEIFVNTETEYERPYAEALKKKIEYYGINVVSVHPYTSILEGIYFFSDYAKRTDDAMKIYERYFDYAQYMGAKFFTFHGERSFLASFSDDKINRDVKTYKRLCDLANSKGLFFAQENVVSFHSQNLQFLENLYEKVPNLRFTLDIKQARRAKTDVFSYIDVMRDRICNVHANDYSETDNCVMPGKGIFDYNKFMRELSRHGYEGNMLIEVYRTNYKSLEDLSNSKIFIENSLI
ncbi:MAG: sugar phosphate isomerase/epimerase [Clostridia bacterium]